MSKVSKTFLIDNKIFNKFENMCKAKNIKLPEDIIKNGENLFNFISSVYNIDIWSFHIPKLKYHNTNLKNKYINITKE